MSGKLAKTVTSFRISDEAGYERPSSAQVAWGWDVFANAGPVL